MALFDMMGIVETRLGDFALGIPVMEFTLIWMFTSATSIYRTDVELQPTDS
jgi:hypothetical protein